MRAKYANRVPMKYRVDIDSANSAKAEFGQFIDGKDPRLLNKVGAFSSLFQIDVSGYENPVLVLKTEEPGTKQLLAFANDRIESVCQDMINHLINDCIVMGATPLTVQDLIMCGKLDVKTVTRIVSACAAACTAQDCALTGGETTEQPDALPSGAYLLGSNIVGIVERNRVIDGSHIQAGHVVVAIASSGPHTNGYTLIRDLLERYPGLALQAVGESTFLEAVLEPHRCYYRALKDLFPLGMIAGLAHITGGGIGENLNRILPKNLDARVDLSRYRPSHIFRAIRDAGLIAQESMLRTFNMGVGVALVCAAEHQDAVVSHLINRGEQAYLIGNIVPGRGAVQCVGSISYA